MNNKQKTLLFIDGSVNVFIGFILMLYPIGIEKVIGLPETDTLFYPIILGAVLFGIGIALFLEWRRPADVAPGLGITGAFIINLFGSMALISCLLFIPLNIPFRGFILLWALGIIVFLLGISELYNKACKVKNYD